MIKTLGLIYKKLGFGQSLGFFGKNKYIISLAKFGFDFLKQNSRHC